MNNFILLVDDEDDILALHQVVIRRFFDGPIVLAASGNAALKRIDELGVPAIIVADYMMPDGDGLFLYDELNRRGSAARFVLCTGTLAQAIQDKFPNAAAIIEKPKTARKLEELIPELLKRL
jgi:DNA-binding NtrC family response regulator